MTEKEMKIVPLTKFHEYFEFPTYGTMRNLCARRKENNTDFWIFINHRCYIDITKFNAWLARQG